MVPFCHYLLKPLDGAFASAREEGDAGITVVAKQVEGDEYADDEEEEGDGSDDEDDDGPMVEFREDDGKTFEETMDDEIETIMEFARGLKYQVQFRDHRMLNTLQKEG